MDLDTFAAAVQESFGNLSHAVMKHDDKLTLLNALHEVQQEHITLIHSAIKSLRDAVEELQNALREGTGNSTS